MDALYIHPAKQEADARYDEFAASKTYPIMPVGVLGLCNQLTTEGWSVRGLNLPLELVIQPTFSLRDWLADQGRPRLVLIDLHWYEHSFGALDVARVCKAVHPDVPVLVGGLTASCFAKEILLASRRWTSSFAETPSCPSSTSPARFAMGQPTRTLLGGSPICRTAGTAPWSRTPGRTWRVPPTWISWTSSA